MPIGLTRHQVQVLAALRLNGLHLIADGTEKCWRRGESYYIDSRIRAHGLRRAFELGNRDAVNAMRRRTGVRRKGRRGPK